jgi:hypothetical protein
VPASPTDADIAECCSDCECCRGPQADVGPSWSPAASNCDVCEEEASNPRLIGPLTRRAVHGAFELFLRGRYISWVMCVTEGRCLRCCPCPAAVALGWTALGFGKFLCSLPFRLDVGRVLRCYPCLLGFRLWRDCSVGVLRCFCAAPFSRTGCCAVTMLGALGASQAPALVGSRALVPLSTPSSARAVSIVPLPPELCYVPMRQLAADSPALYPLFVAPLLGPGDALCYMQFGQRGGAMYAVCAPLGALAGVWGRASSLVGGTTRSSYPAPLCSCLFLLAPR